jgi:hypothetical protein
LTSFPRLNYSKVSQELFWAIFDKIKNNYKDIYFATLNNGEMDYSGPNHEYRVKTSRSSRKLDFYVKDVNKIIEFDGTYWHGRVGMGNKERDAIRELEIFDILKSSTFHVKEMDYNKNKKQIVEDCLNFLQE